MTKDEFIELIESSSDIMFNVRSHALAIFTWVDEGIMIGHQDDTDGQYYTTADDLITNYLVDGIPLSELISEIKITEYF